MPTSSHSVTEPLGADDLARRLDLLKQGKDPDLVAEPQGSADMQMDPIGSDEISTGYKYFAPLSAAADEYVSWSRNPGSRIYTGIDEFDEAMRGLAPSELMIVQGFAHSGKTVFTTGVIMHNANKRVCMFSPDETRVLVLIKLFSIDTGLGAEEIEQRLQQRDEEMEQQLREFAVHKFPNLGVYDEISDLTLFDTALDEYELAVGGKCELVVIDYAQLIVGAVEGADVAGTINAIKSWGKRRQVPIILLHQSSRSKGAGGMKVRIDSGHSGGEQQAIFLVGVRRKRDQYQALVDDLDEKIRTTQAEATRQRYEDLKADAEYELRRHRNTVTFSLVKNKRPPSRLVDDVDFVLDPDTGRVRPFDARAGAESTYLQEAF